VVFSVVKAVMEDILSAHGATSVGVVLSLMRYILLFYFVTLECYDPPRAITSVVVSIWKMLNNAMKTEYSSIINSGCI
jgi:hypothetical protein